MSATLESTIELGGEDVSFTIGGLDWLRYVAINNALSETRTLRTLYLDGSLTLLSPARIHEWSEDALDSIIKVIVLGCGIDMDIVGSTRLRKEPENAGLEGDRAYYLRENAVLMGGPKEIDLAIHPPPDLAIEVENSNQADKAMAIYVRLGVPEVWRHDVRRGTLGFWALSAGGFYSLIPRSIAFPFLTPEDVLFQVKRAEELTPQTRWIVQLNEWVRDTILPRLNEG